MRKKESHQASHFCGRDLVARKKKHELAVLGDQSKAVSPKLLRVEKSFVSPVLSPDLATLY